MLSGLSWLFVPLFATTELFVKGCCAIACWMPISVCDRSFVGAPDGPFCKAIIIKNPMRITARMLSLTEHRKKLLI
jgi:hypothetical protein